MKSFGSIRTKTLSNVDGLYQGVGESLAFPTSPADKGKHCTVPCHGAFSMSQKNAPFKIS